MDRLRFDQIAVAVFAALFERVQAHTQAGKMLDDVRTLMKGQRTNLDIDRPLLALLPGTATPVPGARGASTHTQTYSFPVRIHAQIIADDPITGQDKAAELAGRAQYACLTDPDAESFQTGKSTMLFTPVGEFQIDLGAFDWSVAAPNNDTLFEARGGIVFPRLKPTY